MKPSYVGNVREVYEISDDRIVIVSSDRMSVHGGLIPWEIREKGVMQTKISNFWFNKTSNIVRNHLITSDIQAMPVFFQSEKFYGRTVLVEKLRMLPYEFIVHGYLYGRLWRQNTDKDAKLAAKLKQPIFTCTSKLDHSRDVDVDLDTVESDLGKNTMKCIRNICFSLYAMAVDFAAKKGLILADTKFEFGFDKNKNIVLADEIFTPDSSRYWDIACYQPGIDPPSFDKQPIRNWLSNNKMNGIYQFDKIPIELISYIEKRYMECYTRLLK